MKLRLEAVLAVLLLAAACGNDATSPADSPSPSQSASGRPSDQAFEVAPGRIGPVEVGMTLDEATKTGVVEPTEPDPDAPCPPASLQWKAPNTEKLFLQDHDGKIAVLGAGEPGFTTAEGIGVDSTLTEVETAYPGSKVEESPASGSLVYLKDGNKWLAMALGPQPEDLKQTSTVNYLEVAVDEKPIAYPDGC